MNWVPVEGVSREVDPRKAYGSEHVLYRCPTCFAVVHTDDATAHEEWHESG